MENIINSLNYVEDPNQVIMMSTTREGVRKIDRLFKAQIEGWQYQKTSDR